MVKNITGKTAIICLTLAFLSCKAMPFGYSSKQSWKIPADEARKTKATLTLAGIQIDRIGGQDSLEKEAAALAPLYFWEQKCRVVTAGENPEYSAQINIRERDFNLGWKSKKSLAVEVQIWRYEDMPENYMKLQDQKLPVSVGRVVTTKEESFSSSKTMSRMLSKAIKQATGKLTVRKR